MSWQIKEKVLLHQDNAPSHKSLVAMAAISTACFELLDHPPYSPDLAPSDYRLFPKLKEHLHGKKFSSDNEVMLPVPFFQDAAEMLELRWEKCINLLGDYVEK